MAIHIVINLSFLKGKIFLFWLRRQFLHAAQGLRTTLPYFLKFLSASGQSFPIQENLRENFFLIYVNLRALYLRKSAGKFLLRETSPI